MNTSEDDKSASSDSTNETTDEQKNTIEFRHRSEDMNIAPKEVPVDPAPSRRISGPQTAAPPVQGNSADGEEVSTGKSTRSVISFLAIRCGITRRNSGVLKIG